MLAECAEVAMVLQKGEAALVSFNHMNFTLACTNLLKVINLTHEVIFLSSKYKILKGYFYIKYNGIIT